MWQGAVFFDYDGTLMDRDQGVSAPTAKSRDAIRQLKQNGYLAVLCTGRSLAYIPQDAKNLEFDGYITTNGAYGQMNGTELFNQPLEEELVQSFQNACEQLRISYTLEGQDECFYRAFSPLYDGWLKRFHISTESLLPMEQRKHTAINKMMIVYDEEEQRNQLLKAFGNRLVFDQHIQYTSCDVSRRGTNKGTGVEQFLAHINLSPKQAYAIGDSDNDLEMIRIAGTGIAMEKHSERLGQSADYITDSVANDGVAKALAHFRLVRQPFLR